MHWETAKSDNIGGREEQQDRVELFVARDGSDRMLVLADGMGGHAGGAVASEAVIEAARRVWRAHALNPMDPEQILQRICRDGHGTVNKIGAEKGVSPRSTATILYTNATHAHWVHVGDSRVYHFNNGVMVERSLDHSVVQMLVDMGKIAEKEMANHPDQNRLTQSLGGDTDPEPEFGSSEIKAGDAFLLCSDGLWEVVTEKEMGDALGAESISKSAKTLTKTAAQRGGPKGDNISVAMARLVGVLEDHPSAGVPPAKHNKSRTGLAVFSLVGITAVAAAAVVIWALAPEPNGSDVDPATLKPDQSTARPKSPDPAQNTLPKAALPKPGDDPQKTVPDGSVPGQGQPPKASLPKTDDDPQSAAPDKPLPGQGEPPKATLPKSDDDPQTTEPGKPVPGQGEPPKATLPPPEKVPEKVPEKAPDRTEPEKPGPEATTPDATKPETMTPDDPANAPGRQPGRAAPGDTTGPPARVTPSPNGTGDPVRPGDGTTDGQGTPNAAPDAPDAGPGRTEVPQNPAPRTDAGKPAEPSTPGESAD